jgi:hypothetical protein
MGDRGPQGVDLETRGMFGDGHEGGDIVKRLEVAKAELIGDFRADYRRLAPIVADIAWRVECTLRQHGSIHSVSNSVNLPPPKFILMWDVRDSTKLETRDDLEQQIGLVCGEIAANLGGRARGFSSTSRDDGNGLVCSSFEDVARVFAILVDGFGSIGVQVRAGCEVNFQGPLLFYPSECALGGRAYEYAARVTSVFKEINSDPSRWLGSECPSDREPRTSYLVVSEFARRFAEQSGCWPGGDWEVEKLPGLYLARVNAALPMELSVVHPREPD